MGAALAHDLEPSDSFITCCCVRQFCCWDGRALKDGKICAVFEGPVLVICNHIDDVDVGFVLTALPARFRHRLATATGGEALEALRTPPPGRGFLGGIYDRVKWFLGVSLLNLFPLPREAGFRESFAYAGESVDRGYSILVFPEGRHTTDGKMRPFRAGVGLLANNLAIPVVPMRIDGLFELKQAGKKFARPGQIQSEDRRAGSISADSDPQWIARELQTKVVSSSNLCRCLLMLLPSRQTLRSVSASKPCACSIFLSRACGKTVSQIFSGGRKTCISI